MIVRGYDGVTRILADFPKVALGLLNDFYGHSYDERTEQDYACPVLFDSTTGVGRRLCLMVASGDRHLGGMDWEDQVGLVMKNGKGQAFAFGFGPIVEFEGDEVRVLPNYATFYGRDMNFAVRSKDYDPTSQGEYFSHCSGIKARQVAMELGLENKLDSADEVRQAFEGEDLVRYNLFSMPGQSVVLDARFVELIMKVFETYEQNPRTTEILLSSPDYKDVVLETTELWRRFLHDSEVDRDAIKDLVVLESGAEYNYHMFPQFMRNLARQVRNKVSL